jgi:nicotinamide-nucleotide amidase
VPCHGFNEAPQAKVRQPIRQPLALSWLAVNAETIAVGSELLTPYRTDTNSLYLTEKLNQLGVDVVFKTVVGDHRPRLTSAVRQALERTEIVIVMGGLGPTEDDLSREAVAEALGLEIRRDPEIVAHLEKWFAARKAKMAPNNAKQADVLAGAAVLPNSRGTAPGQWIAGKYEGRDRIVILLPGPPPEMKVVFEQCWERLRAKVPVQVMASKVLKVAMMGESQCDARVAPIYAKYTDVETTILAGAGEIELHLRAKAPTAGAAQERVDKLAGEIEDELEESVFSTNGESLEQIVGYYLQMRGTTIAVAESCTGGMLGERITAVGGSSHYFRGGVIAYSNELKTRLADVPPSLIAEYGAVSREVAAALAEGIRERCAATLGVGITGVAGPAGGTPEKPVGLVFHALADEDGTDVVERHFPGDRQRVRRFATQQALDMVRRKLM